MSSTNVMPAAVPRLAPGTPTWETAHLYPNQGEWTEEEYLSLGTNWLVEFDNGVVEFLPMPSLPHQAIVRFLFLLFHGHVSRLGLGDVYFAALPVRLWSSKYREPDILYIARGHARQKQYLPGADLVIEVVSEGAESRKRDLVKKREEYARAGIAEYWIVDPEQRLITVLSLDGSDYAVAGQYRPGSEAASVLLPGFAANVADCFRAGDEAEQST